MIDYKKGAKYYLNKFWFLLWKDDSVKGWAFSIIVLFIFIKFIFFPLLSFTTGTILPLAIVESCSMYHEGNLFSDFDVWWEGHENRYSDFDFEKLDFQDFKFSNGFNKGDILFIVGANTDKLKIGDVIIFHANQQHPVIHRIVEIKEKNGERIFSTYGDNNPGQLPFETEITEDMILGRAVFKLAPYLGWGKLIFFEHLKSENERGFCDEN